MAIQTTYTQALANFAALCDEVTANGEVVIIHRRGAEDVALISATEFTRLMETAHLLRSPKNAERLLTGLARARRRTGSPQSVEELRREDLRYWVATDRRVASRVLDLGAAILREPFRGIGKPEPLKHLGAGVWSRRLTQEHRLVYLVSDDRMDFLQTRYHY